MIPAFIATLLFSFSILCGHRAAKLAGGVDANFWRLGVATVLLGTWSFTFGLGLDTVSLPWFFLSGLIGFGLGDVAMYQALPRLGSPLTSTLTQCLAPPFAALTEWLWLGTSLHWQQSVAILVILAGVAIALAPGRAHRKISGVGLFWGVIAGLGTGIGAVISRKGFAVGVAAGEHLDGANAGFQRLVGGLLFAGITLIVVRWQQHGYTTRVQDLPSADVAVEKWRKLWPWVAGNALLGSTIGMTFMQWALSTETPAAVIMAIISTTPLAVMPLSRIFEHERLSHRSIAGALVAVGGVVALVFLK
jgi:drug/metabolite transporter (DMT)-like permease